MENPGCVTFRDPLVFSSRVTRGMRIQRATTVAHGWRTSGSATSSPRPGGTTCGSTRSFAGTWVSRVTADVTQYGDAWTDHAYDRRLWGLTVDQGPEHAPGGQQRRVRRQRGAAGLRRDLLRQGLEHPQTAQRRRGRRRSSGGVVDHLTRHRFGNATMHDLVASWEQAGRATCRRSPPAGCAPRRRHADLRPVGRCRAPDSLQATRRTAHTFRAAVRRRRPLAGPTGRDRRDRDAARRAGRRRGRARRLRRVVGRRAPGRGDGRPLPALLPAVPDDLVRAGIWNALRGALQDAAVDPADVLEIVVASLPVEDTGTPAGAP